MNANDRIAAIERDIVELRKLHVDDVIEQEFARMFTEDLAYLALLKECGRVAGTFSISRLLLRSDSGELRRAVGQFCREHRIKYPGAKLIRTRYGNSAVTALPDCTGLLQIFAIYPVPTGNLHATD